MLTCKHTTMAINRSPNALKARSICKTGDKYAVSVKRGKPKQKHWFKATDQSQPYCRERSVPTEATRHEARKRYYKKKYDMTSAQIRNLPPRQKMSEDEKRSRRRLRYYQAKPGGKDKYKSVSNLPALKRRAAARAAAMAPFAGMPMVLPLNSDRPATPSYVPAPLPTIMNVPRMGLGSMPAVPIALSSRTSAVPRSFSNVNVVNAMSSPGSSPAVVMASPAPAVVVASQPRTPSKMTSSRGSSPLTIRFATPRSLGAVPGRLGLSL